MIKLVYDFREMVTALEKIGYTVKQEKEIEVVSVYHGQTQDVERNVWNVFYKGNRIDLWDNLYGTKRIENVFEMEVQKRVLGLF